MNTLFLSSFIDFIYPPLCISCGSTLHKSYEKVCSQCWNTIESVTDDLPLFQATQSKLIASGTMHDLVTLFVFTKDGPFQHIAHALKYKEYRSLGIELGKRIGQKIGEKHIAGDVIVPVPLHPIKQRERGFNQAEVIAQGIAEIIQKPILTKVLNRTRHTQTQTQLNLEQRKKNMANAFDLTSYASRQLSGKTCLLVDDVITTGATTVSCASALSNAGIQSIIATSAAIAE